MRKLCSIAAVFLSIAVLLCGGIVTYAEETHTLRVKFITESGPVTDSTIKLYPALTTDGALLDEFAALPIEVGDLTDSENINRLAYTLASYAASGVGEVKASDVTNGLGYVDFEEVPAGMYLVTGTSGTIGDLTYTPKPALIRITDDAEELLEASLKYTVTATSTVTDYTVKKMWLDHSGTNRPQTVTIDLYRSGELYDEVTLSAENDWTHQWEDLSSRYDWYVIEKDVPADYAVSITLDEATFIIENSTSVIDVQTTTAPSTTAIGGTETISSDVTDTTDATDTSGTGVSSDDSTPNSSGTSSHSTTTTTTTYTTPTQSPPGGSISPPNLPQTGQLWYPVPILFIFGAALFFVGFIADRLSEDDEKE